MKRYNEKGDNKRMKKQYDILVTMSQLKSMVKQLEDIESNVYFATCKKISNEQFAFNVKY